MKIFLEKLEAALHAELPGLKAQLEMAPEIRKEELEHSKIDLEKVRRAAILIPIYLKNNELHTVLIKRAETEGVHSGQMAFAGGGWEKTDKTLIETALRETKEEIGIEPQSIKVLGSLSNLYIPPSNYFIQPVVGYIDKQPSFFLQKEEIDSVLEVPLKQFMDSKNISQTELYTKYTSSIKTPCYKISNNIIWGATAMVISELTTVIRSLN